MVNEQLWNSLELAKLLAGLVTPFVVAGIGYWITLRLKAQEKRSEIMRENEREERRRRHEERAKLAIEFIAAPNEKAIKAFNELVPKKRVGAGFHLTC